MTKMLTLLAAGAVALTGLAPAAASAAPVQRVVVHERTVVRHEGPRWRHHPRVRQVCHWERRRHHDVRVCRTVRR